MRALIKGFPGSTTACMLAAGHARAGRIMVAAIGNVTTREAVS
jgi:hypothetical protein